MLEEGVHEAESLAFGRKNLAKHAGVFEASCDGRG